MMDNDDARYAVANATIVVSRPHIRQEDMGLCNAGSSIIHTANWKYSTYSEHSY